MNINPRVFSIAAQICNGVHPRWCGQHCELGYFQFRIATQRTMSDGSGRRLWIRIGSISVEYLELIEQQKPREQRRAIRKIIRDLREYVRLNVSDLPGGET
jgi:hypothetical protein